jgi:predicted RNA-binding protein
MCETKIILRDGDSKKEIMAEAAMIDVKDGGVIVSDILGNSRTLGDCELEKIDFIRHEAVLKKKG